MDQVFNELSVSTCYPDKYEAQAGMEAAIDVSMSLANIGMSKIIRTTRDFATRSLANGYSVAEWAMDKNGNKEKKRYFLTFATKSPYIENFYDEKEQSDELFEFRFEQEIALGLGLAYLWGTTSISLAGDTRFIEGKVALSEHKMTARGESTEKISVLTLSKNEQIELHKDSIQNSLRGSINNGQDLINNADEMLPFLSFCQNAVDQIRGLCGSEQFFPEVLNHLFVLNAGMREWSIGAYRPKLNYSTESSSTMSNKKYARDRLFLCSDNVERQFSLHSKIKSANKRIYFFPYPEQKIVYIGYVGDHLPTTRFRT